MPILLRKEDSAGFNLFIKDEYRTGYVLDYSDTVGILNTDKILEYLITPFVPSSEEWKELNTQLRSLSFHIRCFRRSTFSFQIRFRGSRSKRL